MLGISSKVDKVIYALCTNITITASKGITFYTFVAPNGTPYALTYYCLKYKLFAHYGVKSFNEEEVIEWLRKLAKGNRKED